MKYPILIALLGLLLCGVGLFAEQGANPQVPINKRAAKSHGATQKVKPEQPKEDQRTTPSVAPPMPDQVSTEKTNAEAAQFKENIEIQRKLVTVTRWLVWVGIVQALILIVQAITFFCTLKGINRQVAQMIASGKQTDELINTMRDTAKAIEKQADLMEGGLHVDGVRVMNFRMVASLFSS